MYLEELFYEWDSIDIEKKINNFEFIEIILWLSSHGGARAANWPNKTSKFTHFYKSGGNCVRCYLYHDLVVGTCTAARGKILQSDYLKQSYLNLVNRWRVQRNHCVIAFDCYRKSLKIDPFVGLNQGYK